MKIYLYIKTHNITGLKYFGKTTKSNPEKYKGSGKYWKRHIAKYGNDVNTEILGIYDSCEECTIAALEFSKSNDIINSSEWANLIEENGLDGAPVNHVGHTFSAEEKQILSKLNKERWNDVDYKNKMISIHKNRFVKNPELRISQTEPLRSYWTKEKIDKHSTYMSEIYWTEERRNKISLIMSKPKTEEHKENISKGLKNVPKSNDHRRKLSLARQKRKGVVFIDHENISYEIHTDFLEKYNLWDDFFETLERGLTKLQCQKLNLDYSLVKGISKSQLGFKFQEKLF